MTFFEFSKNAISLIIEELIKAEKYIHIAVFQLHRKDIFKILKNKLNEGVKIEIFTLPYDSIHGKNADEIKNRFQNLKENGAIINFCCWNVGDPSRTTTAVGQWYSFHGKFIITDKSAIAMSANFTEQEEIDAVMIYNNKNKIEEFEKKFQKLKDLFIIKHGKYDGSIRLKITDTSLENIEEVFNLPKTIKTKIYENHWILDYPNIICSMPTHIENKLYITPFDCKGSDFYKAIISKAEKFVYISTETFTDPDFPNFLKKISLKGIIIKILSGTQTMDFRDRIQKMFRELLAQKIMIKTTADDLHAKLIITDKHIALSSINLNKISLGYERKKGFWRENTETINICDDKRLIKIAVDQFNKIFESSKDVEDKLEEKLGEDLAKMIRTIFNIKSVSGDVKSAFSNLILEKEIQLKAFFIKISKKLSEITKHFNKRKISIKHFNMAVIIYLLSNQTLNLKQIKKKIDNFNLDIDLNNILNILIKEGLIDKVGDTYCLVSFNKLL